MPPDQRPEDRTALRQHLARPPAFTVETPAGPLRFVTAWGLFSAKQVDEGSALLLHELATLPAPGRILDLGCGYGAIGLVLARLWPQSAVLLADKDLQAVESAQANIERNGLSNARAVASVGFRDLPPDPYDLIVSNLPAQAGNEALDGLFLDALCHLRPGGSLVVVVVTGLRRYVQRRLLAIFGDVHKAKQGPRHTVIEAARPAASADKGEGGRPASHAPPASL